MLSYYCLADVQHYCKLYLAMAAAVAQEAAWAKVEISEAVVLLNLIF